jgi:predicted nucleic acid-binding protein
VRIVVADTGPLIHLNEAQVVHLLQLMGDFHIPVEVVAELAHYSPPQQPPNWASVTQLDVAHAADAVSWQQAALLDPGEAEAVALARQLKADWLLTDDAAARLFATELGLEVHGSLGVVLWAAAVGHLGLEEAEQALARLAESSLWISARVLAEAQAALTKMG